MHKSYLLSAALAAALASAGPATVAAADEGDREDKWQALKDSETSLSGAVSDAENEVDGKAIEASLEERDGAYLYDIDVFEDGEITNVEVKLDSGEIETGNSDDADDLEESEREQFNKAEIGLGEAIEIAEKEVDGRAIEASFDDDDDEPAYDVKLLDEEGDRHEVKVDAEEGKILSD